MKILLRPRLCGAPLANAIAADADLATALGARPNAAVGHVFSRSLDVASPLLPRLLALGRVHGERLSFLREVQFSARELDAASHLEVLCRVTIGQSRPDADRTREVYRGEALQPTRSRWPVRLPSRIYLSKAPPPGTIAHVDQWTGEYVAAADVAASLRASGLTGWELRPVLHPRTGDASEGMEHLATGQLLPPARDDVATAPLVSSQPRRWSVLTYEAGALEGSPDFARTAEPWGDWCTPTWVVRQRVRRWFLAQRLRGWAFWPVLEAGSSLHREHSRQWEVLLGQLREFGAEIA